MKPSVAVCFLLSLFVSGCCGGELEARRFNQDLECLGDVEDVGCGGGDDCDDATTVAESEYGSVWRFSSNCIPKGYEVVEGRFAELVAEAPLCAELNQ